MAANLSPEYKEAEAAYKKAREPKERLECLRQMLRTIPKHKGTEHLQADIKTRIKQLSEELAQPKKGGPARGGPAQVVRPEGAAQVALLGPPNVGKSSLHARLTGSHAEIGPYPFTTQALEPGMLPYEDIHFQLVDLPPISAEFVVPWLTNALQPADGALLIVDLAQPDCVDHVSVVTRLLGERKVVLASRWQRSADSAPAGEELDDPFRIELPTLLIANKADLTQSPEEELQTLRELAGVDFRGLAVSATTGQGVDRVGRALFELLGIVRVYTKAPGRPADMGRPFTLRSGDSVGDVAAQVHRGLATTIKYARLWQRGDQNPQQVSRDHRVHDGDVVELHS